MKSAGIDLRINRFACCYRDETGGAKETKIFELNGAGLSVFFNDRR